MESTIRDYNILITYYTKLSTSQQYDSSSDQGGTTTGLATTPLASSFRLPSFGQDSSSSSSSSSAARVHSPLLADLPNFSSLPVSLDTSSLDVASSSSASSSYQTNNAPIVVEEESDDVDSCQATITSLSLSSSSSSTLVKPSSLDLVGVSSSKRRHDYSSSSRPSVLTPSLSFTLCPNSPAAVLAGDEPPGMFIMKKPLDDDEMLNSSGRWSLAARKQRGGNQHILRKSKSNKVIISKFNASFT